jgi:hypothetical protein
LGRKDNSVNFVKLMFERLPMAPERDDFASEEEFQIALVQWVCYAERIIRQAKHIDEQMAGHDAAEMAKLESD